MTRGQGVGLAQTLTLGGDLPPEVKKQGDYERKERECDLYK